MSPFVERIPVKSLSASLRVAVAVLLLAAALQAGQIVPAGNIAADWTFDTVTGTTTPDSSGNNNTGTLVNGPTSVAGLVGNGLQFNGSSQSVTAADSASLDVAAGSFSAAAWVKPAANTAARILNKWDGAKGWIMDINATTGGAASAGFIRAKMNDGTTNIDYSVNGPVPTGAWTHIAIIVDRTAKQLKLFVNGAQVGTTQDISTLTGSLTTTSLVGMGTIPATAGNYFNGILDEVVLYKRVLTAAELTSLSTLPPAAPTALTATNGVNQVTLNWTTVAGTVTYRVLRSGTSGGPVTDPYVVIASGLAGPPYIDTGAMYPNTYFYVVQAVAGATPSANSNQATGTPLPQPITATPNTGLMTNENGATAVFNIKLNAALTTGNSVTFTVTSLDTTEGQVSGNGQPQADQIMFTINGPQASGYSIPITVTGLNDSIVDPATPYQVSVSATSTQATFSGVAIPNIQLVNNDNDVPGMTFSRTSGLITSESGGQDTFTVVLNTKPSSAVNMTLTSSAPGEGTVSPSSLQFTTTDKQAYTAGSGIGGWDVPHTVTVTGVDDSALDFAQTYTIVTGPVTSLDPNYNFTAPDISVTNLDNEVPPALPQVWGGGCGLTGLEGFLLLALLRLRRRA